VWFSPDESYLQKGVNALEQVIAWIVSLITSVAPIGRKQYIPEATESIEESEARYNSIAFDAMSVAYDPQEKPLFSGSRGRARTVMVLLAASTYESSFRKDVDLGIGKLSKGDGGKSWCLNQINLGKSDADGNTPNRIIVNVGGGYKFTTKSDEGWSGTDLVQDRQKCFYAALAVIRSSFAATANLPLKDRLKVYASGSLDRGEEASHRRMGLAMRWMATRSPNFRDSEVLQWIEAQQGPEEQPKGIDLELPIAKVAEPTMTKGTGVYMTVPLLPAFVGLAL
jgi:hypothetical protein